MTTTCMLRIVPCLQLHIVGCAQECASLISFGDARVVMFFPYMTMRNAEDVHPRARAGPGVDAVQPAGTREKSIAYVESDYQGSPWACPDRRCAMPGLQV